LVWIEARLGAEAGGGPVLWGMGRDAAEGCGYVGDDEGLELEVVDFGDGGGHEAVDSDGIELGMYGQR